MASKPASRWAETEEDAALEAQRKKEKEAKKRAKAERARKIEAEKSAAVAAATNLEAESRRQQAAQAGDGSGPPTKRRRLSPEEEDPGRGGGGHSGRTDGVPGVSSDTTEGGSRLLRFDGGGFGKCQSVENYDKLNDIEEGAYGWVARAKEFSTGRVVALKRLKIDPKDRGGLPVTGLREIQILKDCDHRNVVQLKEVVVGDDTSRIEK